MKNLKVDIFKVAAIILLTVFAILYYQFIQTSAKNGRYLFHGDNNLVIDTRDGTMYRYVINDSSRINLAPDALKQLLINKISEPIDK